MIDPATISLGNYLYFNSHKIKVAEILPSELIIEFDDRTQLRVEYSKVRPIGTESNVLLSLGLNKISDEKILNHTKQVFELNVKGKRFFIHGIITDDFTIWRFDNFISFHYVHQLQNICKIISPEFDLYFS